MGKRIGYLKGQELGKYGVKFDHDVEPYISSNGKRTRQAEFICPRCGEHFIARINDIKLNKIQSCGCLGQRWQEEAYFKDLTGQTFGMLTVLSYIGKKGRNRWWHCKCKCGNEIDRTQNTIIRGKSSCGCQSSQGELVFSQLLIKQNINFKREYHFNDCRNPKTGKMLRFDFYLPDYNVCIEFDGRQHYQPKGSFAELESFEDIQYRDKIKSEYCVDHNITLIRIPFSQVDNLDIEDILSIIDYDKEHFMLSYHPMIIRMLEAFDKYDGEKNAINRE